MWSNLILALSFTSALASPFGSHGIHEKRDAIPAGWEPVKRMEPHHILSARIALKQSNVHKLEHYLMDVSDPISPNYGKHWSAEQVAATFAPADETIQEVTTWLHASGIAPEKITGSNDKGWLQFPASVSELEHLLQTTYYQYNHVTSDTEHVACTEYSVPRVIQRHIDFVTPTIHFDVRVDTPPSSPSVKKRQSNSSNCLGCSSNGWLPKIGQKIIEDINTLKLSKCLNYTLPICLQTLYNMTIYTEDVSELQPTTGNSFGVTAYSPQQYNPTDFTFFTTFFGPPGFPLGLLSPQILQQPKVVFINAVNAIITGLLTLIYGAEGNLDVSYGMTLAYPELLHLSK